MKKLRNPFASKAGRKLKATKWKAKMRSAGGWLGKRAPVVRRRRAWVPALLGVLGAVLAALGTAAGVRALGEGTTRPWGRRSTA